MDMIINFINDVLAANRHSALGGLDDCRTFRRTGSAAEVRILPKRRKILASSIVLSILMLLWHAQVGYTRMLGLPHILIWTPLLGYLYSRRKHLASPLQVRWMTMALVSTIVVSLAFDSANVIRYILGERASLVPVVG